MMQSSDGSRLGNTSKNRDHVRTLKHTLASAERQNDAKRLKALGSCNNIFDNALPPADRYDLNGQDLWRANNIFNNALPPADRYDTNSQDLWRANNIFDNALPPADRYDLNGQDLWRANNVFDNALPLADQS
jgi:hypothetical protein